MRRIVLPAAIAAADVCCSIAAADVGIPIEIVIDVYVYVIMPPSAAVTPASAPGGAHSYSNAEGNRHPRHGPARRWRRGVRVNGRAVNYCWIVAGNIDDLRIRLLNYDNGFVFHHLGLDLLLLGGFQISFFLCLLAHALHRIHDIALLRQESITQIRGPLDILREPIDQVGKGSQALYARVPVLLFHGIHQGLVFQSFVLFQPLLKLDDLQRIGRSRENLRQKGIRMKRDWRHQRVQLVSRYFSFGFRSLGCRSRFCFRLLKYYPGQRFSRHEQRSA
jgi:hypothetical protein